MNKFFLVIFTLVFYIALISCKDAPHDLNTVTNLDARQGWKLIKENKNNPDFIILDVRTPIEFNSGHIENAANIDYKSKDFKEKVDKLDKNKTYALYCGSGRRAAAASDIMAELGFKHIYQFGGVKQWQEAGYSLTSPEVQ